MYSRILSISRSCSQICRVVVIIVAASAFFAQSAHARGRWYLDVGGGGGVVASPSALLPGSSTSASVLGIGSLMHDFQSHGDLFSFQLGLSERYVMMGSEYSFITSNILARFELGPIFFGLGGSPYIYRSAPITNSSFRHAPGYSFMAEGGYDWKIIPTFSITASGAMEFVSSNNSLGPAPSIEVIACFRFYFGDRYDPTKRKGYEGEGWRYPRGVEIH